jgi:ATP-dependent DNA helicase DinG
VPDDPLVQARVEALREQGPRPFNEYQVPQAVMMFRQGFGRLIRTRSDWGIVAVLDPRVVSKKYGQVFLRSLPDCAVATDLDAITQFARCFEAKNEPEDETDAAEDNAPAGQVKSEA